MPPLPSRVAIAQLMNLSRHTICPCHSCRTSGPIASHAITQFRKFASPVELAPEKEYAFEIAASNLRFGAGVTREVGMDFANGKATKVCVELSLQDDGVGMNFDLRLDSLRMLILQGSSLSKL